MQEKTKKAFCCKNFSVVRDKGSIFLILAILLGVFLFQASPVSAARFSTKSSNMQMGGYCSNPSPHCYNEVYWIGSLPGSYTQLEPYGALKCQNCSGFIDNEMWLADYTSSQCSSSSNGACWIESGISTWPANESNSCHPGTDSTCLFWADNRPGSGGYHEHSLFNFGSDGVDLTPYSINVTLYNDAGSSYHGSTWDVSTSVFDNGSDVSDGFGQSTNNSMSPSYMIIGSELSNSGATAGNNYFDYSEWESGSGSWNYQKNAGDNGSTNSPPDGYWVTKPCSCTGNTGGTYVTYDN